MTVRSARRRLVYSAPLAAGTSLSIAFNIDSPSHQSAETPVPHRNSFGSVQTQSRPARASTYAIRRGLPVQVPAGGQEAVTAFVTYYYQGVWSQTKNGLPRSERANRSKNGPGQFPSRSFDHESEWLMGARTIHGITVEVRRCSAHAVCHIRYRAHDMRLLAENLVLAAQEGRLRMATNIVVCGQNLACHWGGRVV